MQNIRAKETYPHSPSYRLVDKHSKRPSHYAVHPLLLIIEKNIPYYHNFLKDPFTLLIQSNIDKSINPSVRDVKVVLKP